MPVPIFTQVLLAVLFVGSVGVALTFWNEILKWATNTLFPWIKEYLPELEPYVRNAFAVVDKVVTPIRNKIKALKKLTEIKEAWKILREYLLKLLVQFEQNTQNEWVKRITYWVIRNIESSNKPEVMRVVTEKIVEIDSLPPDVRQELLKRGTTQDVDVTQVRDRELDEAEKEIMSLSQ